MLRKVLLVCLLAAVASAAKRMPAPGRIVGGQEAQPGDFPGQVKFERSGGDFCSGMILDDNTILTAAHCCDAIFSLGTMTVITGEYDKRNDDGTERTYNLASFTMHEDYNSGTFENDICLLQTEETIVLDDTARTVKVPAAGTEYNAGDTTTCSGWGTTTEGGLSPAIINYVEIPFVTDEECNAEYSVIGSAITEGMLCAGVPGEGGIDACQGDSGGPLWNGDYATAKADQEVIGIVSWGYGCARPNFAGVYTQVSKYNDWIDANNQ